METTLATAIARSVGNKAITDKGKYFPIIVQQRYSQMSEWWYHIWWIDKCGTENQLDLHMRNIYELKRSFYADPNEIIWTPL
jgi:hypothetical protein